MAVTSTTTTRVRVSEKKVSRAKDPAIVEEAREPFKKARRIGWVITVILLVMAISFHWL